MDYMEGKVGKSSGKTFMAVQISVSRCITATLRRLDFVTDVSLKEL